MADLLCSFLPLFLPPKRYSSSALHSLNSRRPLHLPLLFKHSPFAASASPSDVVVISTHEHSDGSFLFRFGDPSEVVKNVEMEEAKIVKEEIEGEEESNGSSMVEVLEGQDESKATASGLIEDSDHADSIVSSSNALITVEGESEFSEKYKDEEFKDISPDLDVERTGIDEEYKDLSPVEASIPDESLVEVFDEESLEETSKVTCTSKETEITSFHGVEECLNQEVVDSPADASILDQTLEVLDNVTTVGLLEKESDNISSANVDAHETGKVEEGLDGDYDDSPLDASVLDRSSEVGDKISAVVLLEKETDGSNATSDIEIELTENVEEGMHEVYEDSPVDITSVVDNTIAALSEQQSADVASALVIDIECASNVEQGLDEVLDKPRSVEKRPEVENRITAQELSEKETTDVTSSPDSDIVDTGNVEQGLDEVLEEPSLVEKRHEVENCITAQELSENEPAEITSAPDIDVEYTENVERGLDEVLEEPSLVMPEVLNRVTVQDLSEKETAEANTLVSLKNNPVVSMLDTDAVQGGLETAVTPNTVHISEFQDSETAFHEETVGDDGREGFDNNLVSPSSQPESAMSLYKETEALNLQVEVQDLGTEESSETDVNNIKAIEMQNVLSNGNESLTMEPAITLSTGSEEQASGSGSGMPNKTVGCVSETDIVQLLTVSPQLEADSMLEEETGTETVEELKEDDESKNQTVGGDLAEASVDEVTDPESTESTITSQEVLMTDFVLSSGAALLPHPSKVLTGGEDAYFIADETWLGVADGVSLWSLEGTVPGLYAHELIKNCEKLISECSGDSIDRPIKLLNLSVAQTHSPGSSTVSIARFDGQALHVANVGDSGFIILRHGAIYKRSSPMHHVFSFPVQIERGDDPSSLAQLYRVDLEEEDIIVIATDGLLDNLYDQEISLIATKLLANDKTPKEIAEVLAKKAQEVGSYASARSPFADDAQAAGFPGYSGGKLDDVAVIVSVVQRR